MSNVLTFLGDVFLPRAIDCKVDFPGEYIFNLESPITTHDVPAPNKINLRATSDHIAETFPRKPLAVCLANNHILDYGERGFLDTTARLQSHGIKYFGAGTIAENCNNPLVVEVGGSRVGLMGYVCPSTDPVFARDNIPGVMPLEVRTIAKDIAEARARGAERIIVSLHWGEEHVHLPKPADVRIAHEIIDLGADLIIGHHSHCIQSFEKYKGKAIFYGLGNCVFPTFELDAEFDTQGRSQRRVRAHWYWWNRESLMASIDLGSENLSLSKLSFENDTTLKEKGRVSMKYRAELGMEEGTFSRYNRARKYSVLRSAFAQFCSEPRIPRMSTVKDLMRWS